MRRQDEVYHLPCLPRLCRHEPRRRRATLGHKFFEDVSAGADVSADVAQSRARSSRKLRKSRSRHAANTGLSHAPRPLCLRHFHARRRGAMVSMPHR